MTRTIPAITLAILFVCCSKPEVTTSGDDPAIDEEPDKTETFISIEPQSINVPSEGGGLYCRSIMQQHMDTFRRS